MPMSTCFFMHDLLWDRSLACLIAAAVVVIVVSLFDLRHCSMYTILLVLSTGNKKTCFTTT